MTPLLLIFLAALALYVWTFRVYKAGFHNGLGYGVREFDRLLRETWNQEHPENRI